MPGSYLHEKHVSTPMDQVPSVVLRRCSAPPQPQRVPLLPSAASATRPASPPTKDTPSFFQFVREFFERHDPGRTLPRRHRKSRRPMEEYTNVYEAQKPGSAPPSPAFSLTPHQVSSGGSGGGMQGRCARTCPSRGLRATFPPHDVLSGEDTVLSPLTHPPFLSPSLGQYCYKRDADEGVNVTLSNDSNGGVRREGLWVLRTPTRSHSTPPPSILDMKVSLEGTDWQRMKAVNSRQLPERDSQPIMSFEAQEDRRLGRKKQDDAERPARQLKKRCKKRSLASRSGMAGPGSSFQALCAMEDDASCPRPVSSPASTRLASPSPRTSGHLSAAVSRLQMSRSRARTRTLQLVPASPAPTNLLSYHPDVENSSPCVSANVAAALQARLLSPRSSTPRSSVVSKESPLGNVLSLSRTTSPATHAVVLVQSLPPEKMRKPMASYGTPSMPISTTSSRETSHSSYRSRVSRSASPSPTSIPATAPVAVQDTASVVSVESASPAAPSSPPRTVLSIVSSLDMARLSHSASPSSSRSPRCLSSMSPSDFSASPTRTVVSIVSSKELTVELSPNVSSKSLRKRVTSRQRVSKQVDVTSSVIAPNVSISITLLSSEESKKSVGSVDRMRHGHGRSKLHHIASSPTPRNTPRRVDKGEEREVEVRPSPSLRPPDHHSPSPSLLPPPPGFRDPTPNAAANKRSITATADTAAAKTQKKDEKVQQVTIESLSSEAEEFLRMCSGCSTEPTSRKPSDPISIRDSIPETSLKLNAKGKDRTRSLSACANDDSRTNLMSREELSENISCESRVLSRNFGRTTLVEIEAHELIPEKKIEKKKFVENEEDSVTKLEQEISSMKGMNPEEVRHFVCPVVQGEYSKKRIRIAVRDQDSSHISSSDEPVSLSMGEFKEREAGKTTEPSSSKGRLADGGGVSSLQSLPSNRERRPKMAQGSPVPLPSDLAQVFSKKIQHQKFEELDASSVSSKQSNKSSEAYETKGKSRQPDWPNSYSWKPTKSESSLLSQLIEEPEDLPRSSHESALSSDEFYVHTPEVVCPLSDLRDKSKRTAVEIRSREPSGKSRDASDNKRTQKDTSKYDETANNKLHLSRKITREPATSPEGKDRPALSRIPVPKKQFQDKISSEERMSSDGTPNKEESHNIAASKQAKEKARKITKSLGPEVRTSKGPKLLVSGGPMNHLKLIRRDKRKEEPKKGMDEGDIDDEPERGPEEVEIEYCGSIPRDRITESISFETRRPKHIVFESCRCDSTNFNILKRGSDKTFVITASKAPSRKSRHPRSSREHTERSCSSDNSAVRKDTNSCGSQGTKSCAEKTSSHKSSVSKRTSSPNHTGDTDNVPVSHASSRSGGRQRPTETPSYTLSSEDTSFIRLLETVNELPKNEQAAVRVQLNNVVRAALNTPRKSDEKSKPVVSATQSHSQDQPRKESSIHKRASGQSVQTNPSVAMPSKVSKSHQTSQPPPPPEKTEDSLTSFDAQGQSGTETPGTPTHPTVRRANSYLCPMSQSLTRGRSPRRTTDMAQSSTDASQAPKRPPSSRTTPAPVKRSATSKRSTSTRRQSSVVTNDSNTKRTSPNKATNARYGSPTRTTSPVEGVYSNTSTVTRSLSHNMGGVTTNTNLLPKKSHARSQSQNKEPVQTDTKADTKTDTVQTGPKTNPSTPTDNKQKKKGAGPHKAQSDPKGFNLTKEQSVPKYPAVRRISSPLKVPQTNRRGSILLSRARSASRGRSPQSNPSIAEKPVPERESTPRSHSASPSPNQRAQSAPCNLFLHKIRSSFGKVGRVTKHNKITSGNVERRTDEENQTGSEPKRANGRMNARRVTSQPAAARAASASGGVPGTVSARGASSRCPRKPLPVDERPPWRRVGSSATRRDGPGTALDRAIAARRRQLSREKLCNRWQTPNIVPRDSGAAHQEGNVSAPADSAATPASSPVGGTAAAAPAPSAATAAAAAAAAAAKDVASVAATPAAAPRATAAEGVVIGGDASSVTPSRGYNVVSTGPSGASTPTGTLSPSRVSLASAEPSLCECAPYVEQCGPNIPPSFPDDRFQTPSNQNEPKLEEVMDSCQMTPALQVSGGESPEETSASVSHLDSDSATPNSPPSPLSEGLLVCSTSSPLKPLGALSFIAALRSPSGEKHVLSATERTVEVNMAMGTAGGFGGSAGVGGGGGGGSASGAIHRSRSASPTTSRKRHSPSDPLGCSAPRWCWPSEADAASVAAVEKDNPQAAALARAHSRDPTTVAAYAAARGVWPLDPRAEEDFYLELYSFLLFLYHLNPNACVMSGASPSSPSSPPPPPQHQPPSARPSAQPVKSKSQSHSQQSQSHALAASASPLFPPASTTHSLVARRSRSDVRSLTSPADTSAAHIAVRGQQQGQPRRNKSSPPTSPPGEPNARGPPESDEDRPCGLGRSGGGGGGGGGGYGGGGGGYGGGAGGFGGGGGGGKKRPCACKPGKNGARALSEADVSVAARSVVATVTTAAAFAISAARSKPSDRMSPPVVITGVVEARSPEDKEARSVALFKREPGKKARVATASGTKFAHGISLREDLSFLSVGESPFRGQRHSSGTRPKDNQQQMWFDPGRNEQNPQSFSSPGNQVCDQCMCCERCRETKCQSDNDPELFQSSQPPPSFDAEELVVPGQRKRTDVQPEPPSEQLFSDPSQSSPTVTVRAANDFSEPQEDNQSVAPRSSTDIASEKIIADESLSFANPISEEQLQVELPASTSHTSVSPRPSMLQLPLPLPPPPPPPPPASVPEPLPVPDQPFATLSAVPQTAMECELSQIFAPRSPDVSVMSEGEGHPSSSTASVEEVLPQRESSLRCSIGSATEPAALDIPSDKSIVQGSSGSLADKVKETASTDVKELMQRNQDISIIKSLLRMDAVDFIDVLLPVKFVSDPYERRKNILTNIETFFNRLHPITESEDVVMRRTTHFFEARKLAELIAPWNDIDEVERKARASQFAKQVIETIVSMEEVGENKEIVQIRNFVETFLENIAFVSQCERNHERRRALRFEAFDKLERMFPIKRTLSLQKRSNIEGEIEVLLDKLVPHKQQRDGEEQLNSLQNGIEELLEIIVLSADIKVDLETHSGIRMLVQGFLEDIHSADMTESECERACQLQETIERFVERVLPHKPVDRSIRMSEVRRLTVGLFKDVVIRAQDEKCSLKRTKLRTTGRGNLGKIMYIAEEGRKRKSSVLLHRPQEMLYTIVPEERIKDKEERRMALQNWIENLLENIILSLRTISFVYRKSTLRLLVSKFVNNLLDSEDVEDEFEKRNLVQCFEREFLEKVIPQSGVEDNIIWSKMNVEVRMLLGNVVPLVHKENNPSKRSVLRNLAQEHLQFVFSVTEKVDKWKCCFQQNKFDERLDLLIPEELIKDKAERKSAFIQGVTELLESFVLYEDMGSTVQRRNILYHIVEKFVDDVGKAEGLIDKKDRVNELHRLIEKLVDVIIPTSVANDILREMQVRKEIVRLLKYSILPSFSEENQAKRRIFRSVASEYLLTINAGEATKSDPSVRSEELVLLDLLFPSMFIQDTDKRKQSLIEGIQILLEEIIVSCKPASPLDKKTKLINVINAFVDNTQIIETCHDKHRRKSQIFHQVEDLIEQIIPISDFENNMRLCQTRRELTYFLETIIIAAPNTDNVTRTVQRSTAKKHLHKILLISSVPRNRTATLEKAREIVELMIPDEHKEFEEIVNLLEKSIREICEEIIVFVGDDCEIRTNSELGAAVSNLVANIRGSGSESHGDGRGHLEEVVGGFLERILPHRESEDNVVKSRVVKEVAQMIKGVVVPSFSEKSYARKSTLRSLAMHHLQRLFSIVCRERKTVHKTKELVNELVPAELVKDKKKRKDDLVRIILHLLESCVSSVGIESLVEKNIMNAAVQNFLDDLERIRQRMDKNQGEVTDVVTKLLGTVLPESHCNDLFAGKLRKEIHRLLEDIVTPLQTGLRKSSTNVLRSSASNILENIMAVSEVLKSRRHRVTKSESKDSSKASEILDKASITETESKIPSHIPIGWNETPFQRPDESHPTKKDTDPLSFLTAATGNIQPNDELPTIYPKSNEIICEGCLIKSVVNDAVTKSMIKDSLEVASVCSEVSEKKSECFDTSPDARVVCYISEQPSGQSVITMAKDLDKISEDVKSHTFPVVEEKHSNILDKIIPVQFEQDMAERKSNLKTGIKDFIESIILSGVYNRITMKSQLDGIVNNFVDKMESNARLEDRCQDSSEKQLFVTDLIEEVIPTSMSEDSRVSEVRKDSAKLLNNIVIPSLSIRDVSRRSSMRFNAKELLESIIQEPDVPQVNYQGIMEKLFPKAEVEEKQEMIALKELGITELLETIILFVEVGSPILKRSTLRSSVREFQTNVEEAEEMKDEEERRQEKSLIIADLVKKVIPDQSSEDMIMLRRLREDLLRFLEIVFNTNYGEDVTRAVDAQKTIESIFSIIGAFSRRDSNIRYQKYCDVLDSLIPERLEGTPQEIPQSVKKGIEELMESVVLTMDTLDSVERRSSLAMATDIFMQNLHDIKEMSVFVQDKAEKLVVADLIKKIFPNTSVNDSIHLLEVRRQTTSLLYKAVIPAIDEKNLGRRHLLKTVARERLDNIVLLEELSERSCVPEEEILCLMEKLVPNEFVEERDKRFCRVQRGIERLLEKIILCTEVGKDISMSSVHKFVQMMIDNISELGEDISITEQNFHLEKYTTHLIDGIIPLEEAEDNIRMEKLRNVLLEMLEDVLIIQIVCDGSKLSLIRSLVHEKLLTILSIIKRLQNRIVSVQLKKQVVQMIDDMVPERYVDDEDIRMCILHNAMLDFLKEINAIRGLKQTPNTESALKKEVEMLLSDISSIGDVKDRSARNIRAMHGVALFVRKLIHEEMVAKHANMTRIRNELQHLLIDVIIPAQFEQYPHERLLLREKGAEHLEAIFMSAHTAWKEMQLEDSRTLDIIDDLIPKHLDANVETRRSKLLTAVREFLQKLFPSGNVIMAQCRTIHNKLMDYATSVVTLKDNYDLENKRCSLRKVMHEVIRILNNVLEEHADLRMVSACLEDLLLNVIPRGQMLRGIDARIMLRSEARHLMDMILTAEVPPQDSEQSDESEGSSLSLDDSSSPWDEDTTSRRASKRFLNFIFPWTRKKKNSSNSALEDAGSKAECSNREIRQKRSKKSLKRKRNA